MIYQSMLEDAGEGTGTLNCTDSTLSVLESSSYYKTAPMFFITKYSNIDFDGYKLYVNGTAIN